MWSLHAPEVLQLQWRLSALGDVGEHADEQCAVGVARPLLEMSPQPVRGGHPALHGCRDQADHLGGRTRVGQVENCVLYAEPGW